MALLLLAAAAPAQEPQQVNVAVKIVEFQTTKGVETGLSAYFKQRNTPRPYGRISSGNGTISAADITFPNTTNAGITVFLDRLTNSYGDFELVLQGLVDQNRAFILSRPRAMVPVGAGVPTVIETVQEIPYESTVVVGVTSAQITQFKPTGVNLNVTANQVIDDDGDPNTTGDIFIQLTISATVNEEGQRITVALDDSISSGGIFGPSNALSVPEFVSRSITTTVWVQHGQVLILGGLYRNTKNKNLATLPWLTQGESMLNAFVDRVSPFGAIPEVPAASSLGNTKREEGRRELVFLIRSELWRPAFTVADQFGFTEEDDESRKSRRSPTDMITGVLGELSDIPLGIVEGISGQPAREQGGVSTSLGGNKQ